ncbi:hypothetical protein BDR03DRAFT_167815 [Suillus americanus]|nr:hypothetical protein BDR03DRAFT_167815 [Suillus americanus]
MCFLLGLCSDLYHVRLPSSLTLTRAHTSVQDDGIKLRGGSNVHHASGYKSYINPPILSRTTVARSNVVFVRTPVEGPLEVRRRRNRTRESRLCLSEFEHGGAVLIWLRR